MLQTSLRRLKVGFDWEYQHLIDPLKPDFGNTPGGTQRARYGYAQQFADAPPLVSIVTPTFNPTSALLDETAASVFAQSLQQWEWLLVNDASPDPQAQAVLDRYRSLDPRVRVIDLPTNGGPGAARNAGYRAARSKLVFQLDDDDLIEPTALEKMWWYLHTRPEVGIVNGWSIGFGASEYLWPKGFEPGSRLLEENTATGRALIRRSAHADAGGFDESIRGGFEDWDFWLRAAQAGVVARTMPEYCDWYRRRPTHSDRWSNWDSGDRQRRFVREIRQRYPHLAIQGVPVANEPAGAPFDPVRFDIPQVNRLKKEKRRALLIFPWMTMGGADKFNLDVTEQLVQRGWEVSIATTVIDADNRWASNFARVTPDIFILDRFLRPSDYPAFLAYLIQSRQIDLTLMTNSETGYLLLPFLRTHAPGSAYVDFCHSESRNWKSSGYPRYAAANQELLERNIVSSEYLRGFIAERGADRSKIDVLYTSIDAEVWSPSEASRRRIRAEQRVSEDAVVVVFAGRLHSDKQPRVLAKTFAGLRDRKAPCVGWILGDGPDEAWLRNYLREQRLCDSVHLLGAKSSDETREYYRAADIFFLPSFWEGIALTMFEAMSLGLAVVGAAVGGQPELVTEGTGILLPKADEATEAERYADAIAGLIRDPARRRQLGDAARRRIREHFSLDVMGARLVELLEDSIARRKSCTANLPPLFAQETATLAVDLLRSWRLLDHWWAERQGKRQVQLPEPTSAGTLPETQRFTPEQIAIMSADDLRPLLLEVEQARAWSESQRRRQVELIAQQNDSLSELRSWLDELQGGKDWLEKEWKAWQATAADQARLLQRLQGAGSSGPAGIGASRSVVRRISEWNRVLAFRAMRKLNWLRDRMFDDPGKGARK